MYVILMMSALRTQAAMETSGTPAGAVSAPTAATTPQQQHTSHSASPPVSTPTPTSHAAHFQSSSKAVWAESGGAGAGARVTQGNALAIAQARTVFEDLRVPSPCPEMGASDAAEHEDDASANAGSGATEETEAAASLLELMRAPQMPERSGRKRQRDPSSGSGGSARKKTPLAGTSGKGGLHSQGKGGKSRFAEGVGYLEGSVFDSATKKPPFDMESGGCNGAAAGKKTDDVARADDKGAHPDDRDVGSMPPSPTDMEAVMRQLGIAEAAGEINPNSSKRLQVLHRLLHKCHQEGLLTYETPSQESGSQKLSSEACILGWSRLLVKEPKQLNIKIRDMVEQDQGGIWKKANGKYNQSLKNPTWGVYELFRKIGAKPRFRGPVEGDPGKHDMFYYKEWEFKNDESFKNARQRLAKGFSYCPEKGSRARKRGPKEDTSHGTHVQPPLDNVALTLNRVT